MLTGLICLRKSHSDRILWQSKGTIHEGSLSCNIPLTFTKFVDFVYTQYYEVNTTFRKLCSPDRETGLFTSNECRVSEAWTSPNASLWNYGFSSPACISLLIIKGTRRFSDVTWNLIMYSIISLLACQCLAAPFGLSVKEIWYAALSLEPGHLP